MVPLAGKSLLHWFELLPLVGAHFHPSPPSLAPGSKRMKRRRRRRGLPMLGSCPFPDGVLPCNRCLLGVTILSARLSFWEKVFIPFAQQNKLGGKCIVPALHVQLPPQHSHPSRAKSPHFKGLDKVQLWFTYGGQQPHPIRQMYLLSVFYCVVCVWGEGRFPSPTLSHSIFLLVWVKWCYVPDSALGHFTHEW